MPTPPNASIKPYPLPSPLPLTDSQITCIMQLSRPLQPNERVTFFELLVAKINGQRDLGDGAIYPRASAPAVDAAVGNAARQRQRSASRQVLVER